jgi:hypothetical protein
MTKTQVRSVGVVLGGDRRTRVRALAVPVGTAHPAR